jgi:hypothetical protein
MSRALTPARAWCDTRGDVSGIRSMVQRPPSIRRSHNRPSLLLGGSSQHETRTCIRRSDFVICNTVNHAGARRVPTFSVAAWRSLSGRGHSVTSLDYEGDFRRALRAIEAIGCFAWSDLSRMMGAHQNHEQRGLGRADAPTRRSAEINDVCTTFLIGHWSGNPSGTRSFSGSAETRNSAIR